MITQHPTSPAGTRSRRIRLSILVGHDAATCLDLILDHIGVTYLELHPVRYGAHAVIEVADIDDCPRIVAALRQHLGPQLRDTVVHA
jgi:hypothetical protein